MPVGCEIENDNRNKCRNDRDPGIQRSVNAASRHKLVQIHQDLHQCNILDFDRNQEKQQHGRVRIHDRQSHKYGEVCVHRKERRICACDQVIDDGAELADQDAAEKVYIILKLSHHLFYGGGKAVIDQNAEDRIENASGRRRKQDGRQDPPDLSVKDFSRCKSEPVQI